MKYLLILLLILPASGKAKAENIFEIYKTIPAKLFPESGKHDFFRKNGKWHTTSLVDDPLEIETDIKNGYIHFADDGTGGGWRYDTIALFRNSEGEPIIAQTESSQEGLIYYNDAKIIFLKRHNGKWHVIQPLPKIDRRLFFPEISENLFNQYRSFYRILYILPRFGTNLEIHLHIDSVDRLPDSEESGEERRQHKSIREARKFHKLVYAWDKNAEKFILLKKCAKNDCK